MLYLIGKPWERGEIFPCFGVIWKIPVSSARMLKKVSLSESFLIYTILVSDFWISKSRKLIELAGEPSKKPSFWAIDGSDTWEKMKKKTEKKLISIVEKENKQTNRNRK